jgi:hypothetical protein
MEKLKEMELEILITIRNNEIASNQFYKLFDDRWPYYQECISILSDKGLFIQTDLHTVPGGLKKYELTKQGNNRIGQLLSERTHAVQVKLAHLRRSKNIESSQREHSLLNLFAFFAHFSNRFKRQVR